MDFSQFILTILDKYGVEAAAVLTLLILLLRTLPGTLKGVSTFLQTRATAAATVQTTEVQNETRVLEILQKQVDNNAESNKTHAESVKMQAETNKILLQYQTEFVQSRATNERLEIAIKEFNSETKALRVDLKSWPNTVDGTLAGAITALETLQVSYEAGEKKASEDHVKVLTILEDLQFKMNVVYRWVLRDPTPPTEPARAGPGNVTVLDADGAKDKATVETKAQDAA